MTRDANTKAARRREAAYREKLARNLATLAPQDAGIPQRGTRPQWVTPHVLHTAGWYRDHKPWHHFAARRANVTPRGEVRIPVVDPATCARFLDPLPYADLPPKDLPEPKRGPRATRRRGQAPWIDVAPYVPRYPLTVDSEDEASVTSPSAEVGSPLVMGSTSASSTAKRTGSARSLGRSPSCN